MSEAGVMALLERSESDEDFRTRLEAASVEERRRIIHDAGFDVDPSDVDIFKSLIGARELSDEDLDRIAAGGSTTSIIGGSVGGVVVAGGIAAAVAVAFCIL
jgi:predicted ribosomally synthesized peptide with nif11-like leader